MPFTSTTTSKAWRHQARVRISAPGCSGTGRETFGPIRTLTSGRKTRDVRLESERERQMTSPKNTICIWYDKDAEEAARFYAATFPDSAVMAVHQAPSDFPSGKAG